MIRAVHNHDALLCAWLMTQTAMKVHRGGSFILVAEHHDGNSQTLLQNNNVNVIPHVRAARRSQIPKNTITTARELVLVSVHLVGVYDIAVDVVSNADGGAPCAKRVADSFHTAIGHEVESMCS